MKMEMVHQISNLDRHSLNSKCSDTASCLKMGERVLNSAYQYAPDGGNEWMAVMTRKITLIKLDSTQD